MSKALRSSTKTDRSLPERERTYTVGPELVRNFSNRASLLPLGTFSRSPSNGKMA